MANEKRLIDANALDDAVNNSLHYNPHNLPKDRAMHKHEHRHFLVMIAQAPTVDAVEVVRCKDCNRFCPEEIRKQYNTEKYCMRTGWVVKDDDFCSFGERRTDDELAEAAVLQT